MENRKKIAFIALPFRYPYVPDHFETIIKPSLEESGYVVEKADDIFRTGLIIDQIKQYIVAADLVVCELTGRNANVLYELGLAHSLGKPTVLLTQDEEDIPFDLRHRSFLRYNPGQRGWQRELRSRLATAARGIIGIGSDERALYTQLLPPDDIRVPRGSHNKQLYTIIGLKPEEPVESEVFQNFNRHPEHNLNPVANLWADPTPGNDIKANIVRTNSELPVLRVSFSSTEGTLSPSVGIHPEGLLARQVPRNCTKLCFDASTTPRNIRSDLFLAVRLVNGHAEQWTYCNQNTDGLTKFSLDGPFEVGLRSTVRWKLFRGAGNHAHNPTRADFTVVSSLVLELGCGGSARELGHGCGELDISNIRFE